MTDHLQKQQTSPRAALARFRRDWRAAELCTDPADRAVVEQAARNMYVAAKLAPPKAVVWMDSPLSAALAGRALSGQCCFNRMIGAPAGSVIEKVVSQLRVGGVVLPELPGRADAHRLQTPMALVGPTIEWKLGYKEQDMPAFPASIDRLVQGPGFDAVLSEVSWQIESLSLHNLVWAGGTSPVAGARASGSAWLGDRGRQAVRWAAAQALGVDIGAGARALVDLHKKCGGWFALREVVLLVERPEQVLVDEHGLLHSDTGVALTYRDGFGVPVQHGKWPLPVARVTPWRRAVPIAKPAAVFQDFSRARLKKIRQLVSSWRAQQFAGSEVDEASVEEHVRGVYAAAGLPEPARILWFDSPLAAALASSVLWMHGRHHIDWGLGDVISSAISRGAATKNFIQELSLHLVHESRSARPGLAPPNVLQVDTFRTAVHRYALGRRSWGREVFTDWPQVWEHVRERTSALIGAPIPAVPFLNPRDVLPENDFEGQLLVAAALEELGAGVRGVSAHAAITGATSSRWWAMDDVAILSRPPIIRRGDGQWFLHSADGPALQYRDGFSVYAWRNTQVPADLIDIGWDPQRIMDEHNVEIRRCAIERIGWDSYIEQAGLVPVASAPDPGNGDHELLLYDIPQGLLGGIEARLLLCTNGSVERDGTRRRYGLLVSDVHADPVAAAAETYGVPAEVYRNLQVRR